jgi:hypothetical protein
MFELTSNFIFWLFISLSFISVFSLILLWRQLFRKGLMNILMRFLLLALCQILILSTLGIGFNRSNGFYTSWSDLLGKSVDYSSVAIPSNTSNPIDAAILKSAQKSLNGQVIIKQYVTGEKSGISNIVYIVLPRSAVSQIENGKSIDLTNTKVVEFLAGYPSQPEIWMRSLNIAKALANTEQANPGTSIIGVIPAVNVAGKEDLECMNFPNGGIQTETWLTTDLHSFVDHRLGISPTRWGVMGVSAGGWCSAMLSIKHEDLFYGAVSIAGYYRPALSQKTDPAVKLKLDAVYAFPVLEAAMTGKMNMLLIASVDDIYSYQETSKFRALNHANIDYQYIEIASGGHNARVWTSQLGTSLNWLKQQ